MAVWVKLSKCLGPWSFGPSFEILNFKSGLGGTLIRDPRAKIKKIRNTQ